MASDSAFSALRRSHCWHFSGCRCFCKLTYCNALRLQLCFHFTLCRQCKAMPVEAAMAVNICRFVSDMHLKVRVWSKEGCRNRQWTKLTLLRNMPNCCICVWLSNQIFAHSQVRSWGQHMRSITSESLVSRLTHCQWLITPPIHVNWVNRFFTKSRSKGNSLSQKEMHNKTFVNLPGSLGSVSGTANI